MITTRRFLCCGIIATLTALPSFAQSQEWTLRVCTDYALSHNITVKQQANVLRQRELQLSTARNSRLPNLSATVGQDFSFGRGLTAENTYTNTNTSSTSFSLGTSVPLFTGFQIPNQVRLSELNLAAASADLEKVRNDIRMQVAQAYVQILYDREMADVARRQIEIDSLQASRLEALLNNGKASPAELAQQQATLAQSQLTATQAENALQLSLLALTQLLELSTPEDFSVAIPSPDQLNFGRVADLTPDAIYQEALTVKPEVQSGQLSVSAAERNIDLARAANYPTLNLNGGIGSNYYKTSGFKADGFGRQLENNFSQYVGLNLSVPIFNRFATRNNIRSAQIDRENMQLKLDNTKKTLYKEIQQVYYNTVAAEAKCKSAAQAVRSAEEAFSLMQAKYENGKANSTEFNEAKNTYLRMESDLVKARYELVYQWALIQFYRGGELNF